VGRGRRGSGDSVCATQRKSKKSARVHIIAWHFGHEDFIKTKLFYEKSMDKKLYSFQKFLSISHRKKCSVAEASNKIIKS
jgi:hypothetical protein